MKILLPVDGSDHTKRMLDYLATHGELLAGAHEYTFFTVLAPFTPNDINLAKVVSMEQLMHERAEVVLEPLRGFARQLGWNAVFERGTGALAEAIVDKAQSLKADFIVMGTHGRSAIGNFFMGSVATGVLANCNIPVLLIR